MDKIEAARAAKILADEDIASNSSEESTEDENADLLTGKVETKIFDTLSRIKAKDPSIYDSKTTFFTDDDFKAEAASKGNQKKSEEKSTYKNFIRKTLMQEGADAIAREEEEMESKKKKKNKKTPAEEQRDLQAEIRAAANSAETDDQDLFSIKEQTAEEREQQDEEFARFQAKSERRADNADSVMSNYWRADEDLDEDEQFLRDYVMNRQWLETDSLQPASTKDALDMDLDEEQDDDHLDEADEFEKDYNFRFEDFKGMQFGTGDGDKSLDEYFQLDYEDIIGGDLPTRFKYRKVEPNDYGIPAHVILSKTGKELNQMVSLKKLRPYREDEEGYQSSKKRKKEGKGQEGKGRGKGSSRGRGKGDGGDKVHAKKGSKKDRNEKGDQAAGDDILSSTRFKAYNLEGDKRAGKQQKQKGGSKTKKPQS
ncbi:unnamed protein product [Durusdinium trenchii]|uniref:Kri1-like C-terminal domain-containing protein n=1 Tax=Durusdinium trenchii TaxID=1381693 RepID=A0ABP0JWR3_9DINO